MTVSICTNVHPRTSMWVMGDGVIVISANAVRTLSTRSSSPGVTHTAGKSGCHGLQSAVPVCRDRDSLAGRSVWPSGQSVTGSRQSWMYAVANACGPGLQNPVSNTRVSTNGGPPGGEWRWGVDVGRPILLVLSTRISASRAADDHILRGLASLEVGVASGLGARGRGRRVRRGSQGRH